MRRLGLALALLSLLVPAAATADEPTAAQTSPSTRPVPIQAEPPISKRDQAIREAKEAAHVRRGTGMALVMGGALVGGVGAGLYIANTGADRACSECAQKSIVFPIVLMSI